MPPDKVLAVLLRVTILSSQDKSLVLRPGFKALRTKRPGRSDDGIKARRAFPGPTAAAPLRFSQPDSASRPERATFDQIENQ